MITHRTTATLEVAFPNRLIWFEVDVMYDYCARTPWNQGETVELFDVHVRAIHHDHHDYSVRRDYREKRGWLSVADELAMCEVQDNWNESTPTKYSK